MHFKQFDDFTAVRCGFTGRMLIFTRKILYLRKVHCFLTVLIVDRNSWTVMPTYSKKKKITALVVLQLSKDF